MSPAHPKTDPMTDADFEELERLFAWVKKHMTDTTIHEIDPNLVPEWCRPEAAEETK